MRTITEILMDRDGLTEMEAEELKQDAREAINNGNFDAMCDILGLEDDYIFDLLF